MKFELNKDVKLSETESKAFEYLKALADNQTYTLEVKIYDKEKKIDRYNYFFSATSRTGDLRNEYKTVVSKLIDAFLFQQEMKQKLAN